jgi:hypothetical protein
LSVLSPPVVIILYPHHSRRQGSRTFGVRVPELWTTGYDSRLRCCQERGFARAAIDSVRHPLRSCVADSVSRYGYRERDNRSAREGRPRRGDRGDVRPRGPCMAHRDGIPRLSIWLAPAGPPATAFHPATLTHPWCTTALFLDKILPSRPADRAGRGDAGGSVRPDRQRLPPDWTRRSGSGPSRNVGDAPPVGTLPCPLALRTRAT